MEWPGRCLDHGGQGASNFSNLPPTMGGTPINAWPIEMGGATKKIERPLALLAEGVPTTNTSLTTLQSSFLPSFQMDPSTSNKRIEIAAKIDFLTKTLESYADIENQGCVLNSMQAAVDLMRAEIERLTQTLQTL